MAVRQISNRKVAPTNADVSIHSSRVDDEKV
ncbi:unnamed protein product, partial [Rotaria sp. Silwood1]